MTPVKNKLLTHRMCYNDTFKSSISLGYFNGIFQIGKVIVTYFQVGERQSPVITAEKHVVCVIPNGC